jgi:hypothetical protein
MTIWYQSQQNPQKITAPPPAYNLSDKMSMSIFYYHMSSLLELKQIGTVAEYIAEFWEHLHRVLDLNSDLTTKSFTHHAEGLRGDIQAVVRSRSPSSITSASVLARIREDEITKEVSMGDDKVGASNGFVPTENHTGVFPETDAVHGWPQRHHHQRQQLS